MRNGNLVVASLSKLGSATLGLAVSGLAVSGLLVSACTDTTTATTVRNLDRPSEIAFACFGDLAIDGVATTSAQPLSSCAAHLSGMPPAGQEAIIAPNYFAFVLQPAEGTVAVLNIASVGIQDNDLFTPGLNDIPVGTLPVGMAEDRTGCFAITANSGSCDLAAIDMTSALTLSEVAQVNRVGITTPAGEPLLARPRSITGGPQTDVIGEACPAVPEGLLYIAYPDCNLVAVVDAGTGETQSGLAFRDTGVIEAATDEDFAACPVQCSNGSLILAHGTEPETIEEKPVAVEVSPDGLSLYVTSETSPFFTIVELDADGLPTANVRRIRVSPDSEGNEVGLRNFAVSDRIDMGGNLFNSVVQPVGEFQFVYAIATDSTIRVIDIEHTQECDTQVDPRYLVDETDVEFLSCMPVGDLRTPPRRAGAKGPGIQLPGRLEEGRNGTTTLAMPLDIAFSTNPRPDVLPDSNLAEPDFMAGSFAFATAATGRIFIINVDDDAYADTRDAADPFSTQMPLALPHQLRDNIFGRQTPSENCAGAQNSDGAVRVGGSPSQVVDLDFVSSSKLYEMPFFRGQRCESVDALDNPLSSIVTEFSFAADQATRVATFQDIRAVESQVWSLAWEGPLSADSSDTALDGPIVRKGSVGRSGARAMLSDAGAPFCSLGVEDFDIVSLNGCNPLLDDAQCGIDERCYVHPETTSAVQTGVCIAEDRVDSLSGVCREFLTSRRRYSVGTAMTDELQLIERRRVLRTTPLDGCESATQCDQLALLEPLLISDAHPIEADLEDPEREFSWVCEADPSRAPGIDRCQMACEAAADCEDGFTCAGQRCVEAALPPAECVAAIQRYQVFGGEAFVVLGEEDGYSSALIADPATGECIRPDTANPLIASRIPLRPEPCDDDGDPATGPNPCATTVTHDEDYVPFIVEDGRCIAQDVAERTREAPAVRFSSPGLQFHLVDTETTGDLQCRADKAGTGPAYGTTFAGYQLLFEITNGFLPKIVPEPTLEPVTLPVRITPGPAGNLWILDQGDSSAFSLGRVIRINPLEPQTSFDRTSFQ
tara:strand:- start:71028 stop:74186 length:3159 start_codon:yes stop_codon:yes gene_type:complete